MPSSPHAIVVGAGVVGLSTAIALHARGWRVSVIDPAPGRGASVSAGGMLAPGAEALEGHDDHPVLYELGVRGLRRWAGWAHELKDRSGERFEGPTWSGVKAFAQAGAWTRDDQAAFAAMAQEPFAFDDEACTLPAEGYVDARGLIMALLAATKRFDISLDTRGAVTAVEPGAPPKVRMATQEGALEREADAIVVAGGWRSAALRTFPALRTIKPVKGQIALVRTRQPRRADEPVLRRPGVYIVPRGPNHALVGATSEPGRGDDTADAELSCQLTANAAKLDPRLAGAQTLDSWAGVRPGTPDHAPLLGRLDTGVWVCAGHYRNGILLAPITAEALADQMTGAPADPLLAKFDPNRVTHATA